MCAVYTVQEIALKRDMVKGFHELAGERAGYLNRNTRGVTWLPLDPPATLVYARASVPTTHSRNPLYADGRAGAAARRWSQHLIGRESVSSPLRPLLSPEGDALE